MLCACYSDNKAFQLLPETTNAVESHNRASKRKSADILKVALMNTYKLDMAAALEHLARNHGIPTTYVDLTHDARAKRVRTANAARSRKRARQEMEETDGPPDKHKDFRKGTHTLTSNSRKHLVILHLCDDETMLVPVFLQPKSNRRNPLQPVEVTMNSHRRVLLQQGNRVVSQ